ncbi:MAG: helix-turn-helix domain-containing protein [Dactylosporangium sp.]|nr:helix-turn-helix domain-containing protein [Dactylosporangium sp.]NNJ61807.1 helix-turn-helix domain-containing protein [Dactylosporangium sp.]
MPTTPTTDTSPTTVWTPERIRALGTVTTVPIAASIFGLSRSVAYDLIHTGRFPVPVLRFGRRYRIPVAAILAALHIRATDAPPPGRLDPSPDPRVDQPHEIRSGPTAAPPHPHARS